MDAGRAVVAGRAPEGVIDPDGRGDIDPGCAEMEIRGRVLDGLGRHGYQSPTAPSR